MICLTMSSLLSGLFFSPLANAGEPTCHTTSSKPYCRYNGSVEKIYVNESGLILLYFDTPLNVDDANAVGGWGVTQRSAAVYRITDNPDFAKMLYSTALAAQSSQRSVAFQMRRVISGYMAIDRIWLAE
jgi:hypothetical protein